MAKDFLEKMEEVNQRLDGKPLEYMGGKSLLMPTKPINAGARCIMFNTHLDHRLPLINGEKAILETGYEIRFGDLSSSVTKADADYQVIAKITKFDFSPNHHYYLIVEDKKKKRLDVVERISYHHITESYGYLYNNEYLDSVQVGYRIPKGQIVQKSLAFDEYNNRKEGYNFNVCYLSMDQNMEDSIIISDVAAKKLTAPLIKPVRIMINENDIPLNIYGTEEMYKCIPDIGEDIKDAILIALRKEKKEESIYAQSVERLRKIMMSDEKFTLTGKVIDVNIYCNNPENLETYYNGQFKMYYDQLQRMSAQIVTTVTRYVANGYELSYDLQKIFANAKRVMNKDQYMDKRQFSNIVLEVVVLEERELQAGDKISNRYGGKGVLSSIREQKMMPRFGDNEYVDIILNSNGVYGRENPGQLFELSITHIGTEILRRIGNGEFNLKESYDLILKYINFISPEEAMALSELVDSMDKSEKQFFLESIVMDGAIHLSAKPMSEAFSIDQLAEMYKAFPWVKQVDIEVPMEDSMGEIRYVKARRPVVVGKQYTFRLKQYAEEKFSATSLSATNIRNENTKSKASRDFRELYSNTPIRFGNMESNDMLHLGAEYVIKNLMIHSISPHARRLTEQMYTCNPFSIDIKLDEDSTNRSAEIANVYLKTIGRRLIFEKIKKFFRKLKFSPVTFGHDPHPGPAVVFNKEKDFDFDKAWEDRQAFEEQRKKDLKKKKHPVPPVKFGGADLNRLAEQVKIHQEYEMREWEKEVRMKKLKNQK